MSATPFAARLAESLELRIKSNGPWREEYAQRVQELSTILAARGAAEFFPGDGSGLAHEEVEQLDAIVRARVANLEAAGVAKAGAITRAALNDVFGFALRALFALL